MEVEICFLGQYYVSTIAYLKAVAFVVGFTGGFDFRSGQGQVAGPNCKNVCLLHAITTQAGAAYLGT